MIPQPTIEQIAAANDIVDVIGGYFPLKRAGAMWKALCPFHREKSPSFTVNPQRQIFKCFGCGAGGSVFKFVQQYESVDFPTAVKKLADRAGIRIVEEQLSADDDKRLRMRKRLLALHHEAAEWFHRNLMKTAGAKAARDYLKKRGINSEIAASWKIGYAPESWDALGNWAHERGFSRDELIASGLVKLRDEENAGGEFYDRFRDRVMFPICNDLGEVIAFSGRVLQADAKAAKYVNSPETMLFTKGNVLFGLHKSKRALIEKESAIVCEGQLDLITVFESGIQNVTAPQGTAFTERQARVLKRFVNEVVLCFDADTAGKKASDRSLGALIAAGIQPLIAELPVNEDPDSFIQKYGPERFRELIESAEDFFDFRIRKFSESPNSRLPKNRSIFAKEIAEQVNLIANPVAREATIVKIAALLEVSAKEFDAMVRSSGNKPDIEIKEGNVSTPHEALHWMCLLALRDSPAREWLLSQPWRDFLANKSDGELLLKILQSNLRPDDPHSVNAFVEGLDDSEQLVISSLLSAKLPANAEAIVNDCWNDLRRREIKRRQEVVASRLRQPNLPMSEVEKLQKEILDLQKQLQDIARLFSPSRSV